MRQVRPDLIGLMDESLSSALIGKVGHVLTLTITLILTLTLTPTLALNYLALPKPLRGG
jgi:hypothetical protein